MKLFSMEIAGSTKCRSVDIIVARVITRWIIQYYAMDGN